MVRQERRVAIIFIGHEPAAALPTPAGKNGVALLDIAAVGRASKPRPGFDAIIIALEHDVDDATDCVGSIDGRGSVGDDLDPIDRRQRDGGNIDALSRRIIGHAPTIQDGKRRIATQAPQIDGRSTTDIAARAGGDIETDARILSAAKALRQAACHLAQVRQAAVPDRLFAQDCDGRSARRPANPTARDDDPRTIACRSPVATRLLRANDIAAIDPVEGQPNPLDQPAQRVLDRETALDRWRGMIPNHVRVGENGAARLQRQRLQ